MANTSADDVAELKQELAQFLLAEITSAQGAQAFRKEVGAAVAAVIDQVLNERLTPAVQKMERQAAEQSSQLTARVDQALRRFEQNVPAAALAAETEQKIAELTARLEEMRTRLPRPEEPGRGARATAQPLVAPKLVDERIAVTPKNTSVIPRWTLWVIIVLLALVALGLGNIYYERLMASDPATSSAVPVFTPPPASTPSRTVAPNATPSPVAVPPQNPAPNPAVTPAPAPHALATPPVTPRPSPLPASVPPLHAPVIPADFAIERGWLAAQPFAVDRAVARRAGSSDRLATLRSIVCGHVTSCSSDLLFNGPDTKQLIVLQMLMAQIGDQFCIPRRSVHVTGEVTADGLSDLADVARCAGAAGAPCNDGQNKVCPPDADSLQEGSVAARGQLLRWALWKTGST